jgi:hypothetical protein
MILPLLFIFISGCTQLPVGEGPKPTPTPKPSLPIPKEIGDLLKFVDSHACTSYSWHERGRAPKAYMKGMAVAYARAVCNMEREDILTVVSKAPQKGAVTSDALSHYAIEASPGIQSIRKTYQLLIGLGMRESSGKFCEGRDMAATNYTHETCEAGLFQTSYNSRVKHSILPKMYEKYKADGSKCYLDLFKDRVSCTENSWKNWGEGEGVTFQKLSKECPMFATEYAAVMVRVNGGSTGHYGPLRKREAGILPACEDMLESIDIMVNSNRELCKVL